MGSLYLGRSGLGCREWRRPNKTNLKKKVLQWFIIRAFSYNNKYVFLFVWQKKIFVSNTVTCIYIYKYILFSTTSTWWTHIHIQGWVFSTTSTWWTHIHIHGWVFSTTSTWWTQIHIHGWVFSTTSTWWTHSYTWMGIFHNQHLVDTHANF